MSIHDFLAVEHCGKVKVVIETRVETYVVPAAVRELDLRAAIQWTGGDEEEDAGTASVDDFHGFSWEEWDSKDAAIEAMVEAARVWFGDREVEWHADDAGGAS